MSFKPSFLLFAFFLFCGEKSGYAQVEAAPVSPVQSESLAGGVPALPGLGEYEKIPIGLLAPPETPQEGTVQKPASLSVPASKRLPDALGQIPGVYKIPGLSEQAQSENLTVDDIKILYRKGAYSEAYRELEPLVANGNIDAEELSGIMLLQGQGTTADPAKAMTRLLHAAESNKLLAQHYLGNALFQGVGMETPDPIQALTWLEIAFARYPKGPQKIRARQDRDVVAATLTRLERERAKEGAKKFLEARDEAHLLEVGE